MKPGNQQKNNFPAEHQKKQQNCESQQKLEKIEFVATKKQKLRFDSQFAAETKKEQHHYHPKLQQQKQHFHEQQTKFRN